jgi:diguanylate cyclase (GGDEF)-like protein/PAS domain S-box-containing protein
MVVPYGACILVVIALLPAQGPVRVGEVSPAVVLLALVGAALAFGARLRVPAVAFIAILAFFAAVALLRDGSGANAGYAPLVLLPIIWSAVQERRAELVASLGCVALAFLIPIALVGGARYPAEQWRMVTLLIVVCGAGGVVVMRLMQTLRSMGEGSVAILDAMRDGWALTRNGEIVAINPALSAITGFSDRELVGVSPPYPFWPDDLLEETEVLRQRIVDEGGGEFEMTMVRADGTRFPALVTAVATDLPDDGARGFLNTVRDISARKAHELAISRHAEELSAIADVIRAVGHTNPDDARRTICQVALSVTGATMSAIWELGENGDAHIACIIGAPRPQFTVTPERQEHGVMHVWRTGEPLFVPDARASGHCDPRMLQMAGAASVFFQPINDAQELYGVLEVSWPERLAELPDQSRTMVELLAGEAATALQRANLLRRLDELARTDQLTGLANRRTWDEALDREIRVARRTARPLSVVLMDLDHFKAYNDRHGHLAGDRLLRTVASTWQANVRDTDLLARWGGEEFALLLPGCAAPFAGQLVERMRRALPGEVTFSAGVCTWDHSLTPEALLSEADRALYGAKAGGRNRTHTSAPALSS